MQRSLTANLRPIPEQISELRNDCPLSIALSHGDRQLSFEELDCKADQFAAYLTKLGVVCGDTVAICMERSIEWIVATLGIMRAGAAYVPLDTAWPDERLRFAVSNSGATILVFRAGMRWVTEESITADPGHAGNNLLRQLTEDGR